MLLAITIPYNFQGAKMAIYSKYKTTSDIIFACFTVTWIASRLGLYPTWILYSTTIEAAQIVQVRRTYRRTVAV